MSELRRTETCAETASHECALLRVACMVWLLAIPGCVTGASGNHGSTTLPGSAGEASTTESNAGGEGALPGAGSAGASSTMPGPRGFECRTGTVDPGPSPMKLLTRTQYLNSVHDLLGEIAGLDGALGAGRSASAFGLVQPDVAQVDLENYRNAANQASLSVASNKSLLEQLAPCADGDAMRDCARTFVQTFAARAYRAPVTDVADIELHLQLFDVGAKVSYAHGIELLMQGILQAPRFLYRVEVGGSEQVSDTAVKLSPYELASRLSYALWDTMPNEELTAAASSGGLATKEGLLSQLAWMLQAPQGASVMRRFLENFIHLSDLDNSIKDATLYPEWQTSTLRASMKTQASTFFDDLLTKQGGKLSTLLTSRTVFVNQDLAPYYGTTSGASFTATNGVNGATSGILTLPAFLSVLAKPSESSPIYRGKFVREMLLCQQLPAPPANIPKPPDVTPGVSTRERLSEHESNASCSGCHRLMDPIGLAFENYDSLGRFRTMDGQEPVDASGELFATAEIDGKFTGVPELGQKLAQSETVRQCMARQWFRFALQRFEQPVDDCSMQGLLDSFETADADLNTLPQAIVLSDAFQYRHPVDSETSK